MPASEIIDVPFSRIAAEEGSGIFANTAAAGFVLSLFKIDKSILFEYLKSLFLSKGADIVQKNISAAEKGYVFGAAFVSERPHKYKCQRRFDR